MPATSTTTTSTTTTNTTAPLIIGHTLPGKVLLLKDNSAHPARRRAVVLARDAGIDLGDGKGSADDPLLHAGTLRIVSSAGDGFDETYALPAGGWVYLEKKGVQKGYRYVDAAGADGPIRLVVVKRGKLLRALGVGSELGFTLGTDPNPVEVVLTIGEQRYCLSFGGTTKFVAGRKYRAKGAPAPSACPSDVPPVPAPGFARVGDSAAR